MKLDKNAILVAATARVVDLVNQVSPETIDCVLDTDDADEGELNQLATDRAVDGDYVGAIICEEAAKLVLAREPKR
ncbi:MAG: hypothetical protein WC869_01205 [Phycisphaerae bacterium]|jgi:hypothetical protein